MLHPMTDRDSFRWGKKFDDIDIQSTPVRGASVCLTDWTSTIILVTFKVRFKDFTRVWESSPLCVEG